jgi:hypothetical protein
LEINYLAFFKTRAVGLFDDDGLQKLRPGVPRSITSTSTSTNTDSEEGEAEAEETTLRVSPVFPAASKSLFLSSRLQRATLLLSAGS